jgi:hypothetical protein
MNKKYVYTLILALILFAFLTLACGGGGEWSDWQKDIGDRQRNNDIPVPEVDGLDGSDLFTKETKQ